MRHLSLTLISLLVMYLIYLYAPIPGLSHVKSTHLQAQNIWAPGDINIIHHLETHRYPDDYWILGSSVGASFFSDSRCEQYFPNQTARVLHTTFAKISHMNTLMGSGGLYNKPSSRVVVTISPDVLINWSRMGELETFRFQRKNRAHAWRLSLSNAVLGNDIFLANEEVMNFNLGLKKKQNEKRIEKDALILLQQARDRDDKLGLLESEINELIKLNDYLKSKKSQLLVVVLPMQPVLLSSDTLIPNNITRFKNACATHNIPFLDMSAQGKIEFYVDWGHFSGDAVELNGVQKVFSDWVKNPTSPTSP